MESAPPQGLVNHGQGQHAPMEGHPQHPMMGQEMSHAPGGPPEHHDNPLAPEHAVNMGGTEHAPHGGLQQVGHKLHTSWRTRRSGALGSASSRRPSQ